ncbi:hypothetical protein OG311_38070 (plasmid) [Streptomyces sp. NBC_01343]|uniref:hypothetical protein n=1 Tax=Streptomyces sp. NBC_01343 TaxID=2903832 RepID=UPI002E12A577|nr:hypothetical protein OG311_38070 [Streptomyces sp. NBC_01343]
MRVTVKQIKDLWHNGGIIDRGEDYPPLTQDDLGALDVDTDETGVPLDDMWEVLADQLNSNEPGEPSNDAQRTTLELIEETVQRIHDAEIERDALIRQAIAERAPVIAIAERAGLSRARVYQIRDGRR